MGKIGKRIFTRVNMERINWKFTKKHGKHWIKNKFYKTKSKLKEGKRIEVLRLFETVENEVIDKYTEKMGISSKEIKELFKEISVFEEHYKSCGRV